MNNPSPLVPQGSLLEQKNKGRARVKIAVFVVLAIHGIGLLALLMQGCKPSTPPVDQSQTAAVDTNPPPTFQPTNNQVVADTNPAPTTTPSNPPPAAPEPIVTPAPTPMAPVTGGTDYKIVKGDTFSSLHKKFHVSLKELTAANPGVDSSRLKVGQTIHIPAGGGGASAAPAAGAGAAGTAAMESVAGDHTYKVKSGDTLTKIAGQFGVSLKALRAANSLKTDKIKVGQELKIPAKAAASAAATPAAPVETVPATPPPSMTPAAPATPATGGR